MGVNLTRKLAAVESDFWAAAKEIKEPFSEEQGRFYEAVWPLDSDMLEAWMAGDGEAAETQARLQRIEDAMPAVHPAFLPDCHPAVRRYQWCLRQSGDYRELSALLWQRFIAHVHATYDLEAGRVAIVLCLHGDWISRSAAQFAYIGEPFNPEVAAGVYIEVLESFWFKFDDAGEPTEQGERECLWRQAIIQAELMLSDRPMTEADVCKDEEMWRRISEDMAAGVPSDQSEAAAYFRAIYAQYPIRGMTQPNGPPSRRIDL